MLPTFTPAAVTPCLDFSDNFDQRSVLWSTASDDVADVQVRDGGLDVGIKKPRCYTAHIIRWYTDLIIEGDVRQLDDSLERFGLMFRFVLYINGQKVAATTDASFSEGGAGVVGCTCEGYDTLHVQFDNIAIYCWPD